MNPQSLLEQEEAERRAEKIMMRYFPYSIEDGIVMFDNIEAQKVFKCMVEFHEQSRISELEQGQRVVFDAEVWKSYKKRVIDLVVRGGDQASGMVTRAMTLNWFNSILEGRINDTTHPGTMKEFLLPDEAPNPSTL